MQHKNPDIQQAEGISKQFAGRIKEAWGSMTDDDLDRYEGSREQLEGFIEQKTGEKREAIRERIEFRERAVRMVFDHEHDHSSQWATIQSVAHKIGCTPESLRQWVRRRERDEGRRPGPTSDDRARLKELERENRELRQANEILRKASAYFALAEFDRRRRDLG